MKHACSVYGREIHLWLQIKLTGSTHRTRMISGFRREVDENWVLLGGYALLAA